MILNNYGPNTNIGSINVEMDYKKTLGEIYPVIHTLQMKIYQETHVYLILGFMALIIVQKLLKKFGVFSRILRKMNCIVLDVMEW